MKSIVINVILLILTFITTTLAGVNWIYGAEVSSNLNNFYIGLPYSVSILFIISSHEFGHYFASRYHKVSATLPYYIPSPVIPGFINFGTFGAVIKTKSSIDTKRALFDIGISGPIFGFIASVIILIYGFSNLPSVDYILTIHPDYFSGHSGKDSIALVFGENILYKITELIFTSPDKEFIPPMSEMYHYPYLISGWFGLFITSLNLLPIGQLDGGHILYAIFDYKTHLKVANTIFYSIIILGLLGFLYELNIISFSYGWTGWLIWALFMKFIIKIPHPEINFAEQSLDKKRIILGYFALFIFIVSFTPSPFYIKL